MDSIRSYAAGNRSLIINVIYVVAFIVAIYYLYKWFKEGNALDLDLLSSKINAGTTNPYLITDANKPSLRITTGGEYTYSMWMYINSWDGSAPGKPKKVFFITDTDIGSDYLMVAALYPNTPKMLIRTHTRNDDAGSMTRKTKFDRIFDVDSSVFSELLTTTSMPQCDVHDVDLQRWIHLAVSINGRIMDVYMDGKLARSCILPDIPVASEAGNQGVYAGGFPGYVSGIKFRAYALTPDRVYAEYQAGPYSSSNFMTFIAEKFGIRLNYVGAFGEKKSVTDTQLAFM